MDNDAIKNALTPWEAGYDAGRAAGYAAGLAAAGAAGYIDALRTELIPLLDSLCGPAGLGNGPSLHHRAGLTARYFSRYAYLADKALKGDADARRKLPRALATARNSSRKLGREMELAQHRIAEQQAQQRAARQRAAAS